MVERSLKVPKYSQPPLDAGFNQLMLQSQQQDTNAILASVARDTQSETMRYGTLTPGDNAMILARYGANLAMAGTSGSSANPLLRKVA